MKSKETSLYRRKAHSVIKAGRGHLYKDRHVLIENVVSFLLFLELIVKLVTMIPQINPPP